MDARRRIAGELLGEPLSEGGFARCPGAHLHQARTGPKDFRVLLDGAPTGSCFHASCAGAVDAFNLELRRRIARAESGARPELSKLIQDVAPEPRRTRGPSRPEFDRKHLAALASRCPVKVSPDWLADRSPVSVPRAADQGRETALRALASLYRPGERALVFTAQWSQGDFLFEHGRGTFRLGKSRGMAAVKSALPTGGPEGVWFLAQPVRGTWEPYSAKDPAKAGKLGRRHGGCVTSWRYAVIESDEAEPELWLRALVQLPLPIAAVYTSGGRSIHALAQVDCLSKSDFDELRNDYLIPSLCPLGADPAALTAVRLTRLPGMLRCGTRTKAGEVRPYDRPRLQRLLWLNPDPPAAPILEIAGAPSRKS